jgi:hypothetical protein
VFLNTAIAGEWSGNVAVEFRGFLHDGVDSRQDRANLSLSALYEYYTEWNNANDSFTFTPFVRIDSDDSERTHADIRELKWTHVGNDWELDLGISKVYWGVTESQHLVDIVNQTDLVENIDGEDKLGQPMVKLSLVRDWGIVDLFMLPGFRERTFPGKSGRLRSNPYFDTDLAIYEDRQEDRHIDWAARWSHSLDIWDIGLSHFSGTGREPLPIPTLTAGGDIVFAPFYEQIDQTGLDVQATIDSWLLKLELISRHGIGDRYTASTAGFEYTLYGIFDSRHDMGLIAEYLYDERGRNAVTLFEDDLFLGARWTWNDSNDTDFIAGIIQDSSSSERVFRLEGSRRLDNGLKLSVESQFFSNIPRNSRFAGFRQEDFVQVELAWYF